MKARAVKQNRGSLVLHEQSAAPVQGRSRTTAPAHPVKDRDPGEAGRGVGFGDVPVFPRQRGSEQDAGASPLPARLRQKMESAFGADFSDVRVHQGPAADSLGALAFTQGRDIHFAPGQYNPASAEGQRIIAHELGHVVQQRQGRVALPSGGGVPVNENASLESEADSLGARAVRGEAVGISGAAPGAAPAQQAPAVQLKSKGFTQARNKQRAIRAAKIRSGQQGGMWKPSGVKEDEPEPPPEGFSTWHEYYVTMRGGK